MLFDKTNVEQFAAVPVTLGTVEEWRTLYFLVVNDIDDPAIGIRVVGGEIIEATGFAQLRNDLTITVEVVGRITLRIAVSGGAEDNSAPDSVYASPVWGPANVTPETHYAGPFAHSAWKMTASYPKLYLCFRARCRSSAAQSGHTLSVLTGQGEMFYFNRGT